MSVSYKIPVKNRFFMTNTQFQTAWSAYTVGRYDFGSDPTCQNIVAFGMEPENTYLINQISVGGIIGESDYLNAVDVFPTLSIKRSKSSEPIYQQPMPIAKYYNGIECSAFVKTDLQGESVTLSLSGLLRQIPILLGVDPIKLIVTLSVMSIANTDFNKYFDGPHEYKGDSGK